LKELSSSSSVVVKSVNGCLVHRLFSDTILTAEVLYWNPYEKIEENGENLRQSVEQE